MKKIGKIILYAVILILIVIVGGLSYISLALPNVGPAENITAEATPARLARGDYLANNVANCFVCHSRRDRTKLGSPPRLENKGGGGDTYDGKNGLPGSIVMPNITPFKLKDWTDGDILRAMICGVNKEGKALFPLMPYPQYAKMDREDLYSIIAYIRTLAPVPIDNFKKKLDFPFNFLLNTLPKNVKARTGTIPKTTDSVKYGAYLVLMGECELCHSRINAIGLQVPGSGFGGGRKVTTIGIINSMPVNFFNWAPNITPDKETGIGKWTSERFVKKFKSYADTKQLKLSNGDFQSAMPWPSYAGMSEGDLKSIFAFLRTVKPIHNKIDKVFELAEDETGSDQSKDQ